MQTPEQLGADMGAWAGTVRAEQERAREMVNLWAEAFHAGMLLVLGWYGDQLAGRTTRYGRDGELQTGVLTPAVRAEQDAEPAPAPEDPGEHFGTVGERAEFDLTVTRAEPFEGLYGPQTAYGLEDAEGNAAVWFHSAPPGKLEVGRTYRLRGRVKEHGEHEGRNQTVLTRCKVVEAGAPKEPPPKPVREAAPEPDQSSLF